MSSMDMAGGGFARRGRRLAAAPHGRKRPYPGLGAVVSPLLALAAVTEAMIRSAGDGDPQTLVFNVAAATVLALATTVPMGFLDALPAALAVTLASMLSLTAFHTMTGAGAIAQLIVLYRLGRADPWRGASHLAVPALAVPFVVAALAGPRPGSSEEGVLTVLLATLAPAAAWAGLAQRARDEAHVHGTAREAVAQTLKEHTARGERARIARELHDVVAHHISVIAVQAETARLTTPGMPPAGAQRLSEIGDTARAGLTEMRRLLGVLREDASAEVAERHPQPGLQQLNELIDEARAASGTAIRLIVSGAPAALDPGVELAAYRIVQEALTNARRHAQGAAVDVELHYTSDSLDLRIRDNGPGPPGAGPSDAASGHGLTGMRERAMASGGELMTGAAAGGGFLIEATLPVKAEAAT